MILKYTDIFSGGKIRRIKAEITTDHPASSYGLPVLVLADGHALDAQSWVLLSYQIVALSKSERPLMERWINNLYGMLGMHAALSKAGSTTSEAKSAAARENGKLGGRPKKIKWKSCEPPYIIKIDLEEIA